MHIVKSCYIEIPKRHFKLIYSCSVGVYVYLKFVKITVKNHSDSQLTLKCHIFQALEKIRNSQSARTAVGTYRNVRYTLLSLHYLKLGYFAEVCLKAVRHS